MAVGVFLQNVNPRGDLLWFRVERLVFRERGLSKLDEVGDFAAQEEGEEVKEAASEAEDVGLLGRESG